MLNEVKLIGHLGADPEIRRTQAGAPVANLRIATSERWTDKATGEKQERTEWHRVTVFNENLCKVAEQYLKKGARVFVQGQLATRKWQDQAGKDCYSTEVVLRAFDAKLLMLDRAERAPPDEGSYGQTRQSPAAAGAKPRDAMDDEIPF